MRSLSRSLLLVGLLALVVPTTASAQQDYSPSVKPFPFVPLGASEPGVQTLTPTGGAITGLGLPFPVVYYGQVFNQVNVSTFGYLTFSSRPGFDEQPGGRADPFVATNQYPLPNASRPNGVIAAWWDDLRCPAGSIKARDAVIQGSRTFTVEWNGCYREAVPSATVQMQVRFTEWSPIIRVFYGDLGPGGTHDATVGLEDPVKWNQDAQGNWVLAAPGGSTGVTPAMSPVCPVTGCAATSWPTQSMIQYGRPPTADLQAGFNASSGALGLQITGLSGVGTITATIQNNVENGGLTAASGVTWDYYLSTDDVLDPAVDTLLACPHTTPESVPATTVRTFVDTCTATLTPGFYHFCTYLDPPTATAPDGVVPEANESNNAYCSPVFVVGADIAGSIAIPGSGAAGGMLSMPIHVENRGTDATPTFKAQVWLQDCAVSDPTGNLLAWETTLSLAGGAVHDQVAEVPIRPDTQGTSICAVLVIDPDGAVPELDESNNSYSTCVAHGELPRSCATIARPDLRIQELSTDLPLGCFFGESVGLHAELCNDTEVEARSFGLAFYVDINSVVTTNDTRILSIPQACTASAECIDIGGGAPTCVEGICQAPCLVDADCGTGGLECEPSFVVAGKTCQLVLPGETCKVVSAVANVPTFDTRAGADFLDDDMFFGAIVDWTEKVGELIEGNQNKKAAQDKVFCWTRKPDFETVELRTLGAIAPGEVVPVYRRVRNHGAVGGAYSYRYVLSSNSTVSVHDLGLEIVGHGLVGADEVEARSDDVETDMVRLPAGVVPGNYYLGMILDPEEAVLELSEDNNTTVADQVRVVDSSLRIVTSSLRDATVGSSYTVQLLAAGGAGSYVWSLVSGQLPPGLALAADGLLSGTILEPGIYAFGVKVSSGGSEAGAVFAIEAVDARGPLAISLGDLPPAIMNQEYRVVLAATGGLAPYAWTCPSRPAWLNLQGNLLYGTPAAVAAPVPLTCTVTDASGSLVSKTFSLAVYSPNGFRIRTTQLTSGDVGLPYEACVTAEGGSGRYAWTFDLSGAPAGIAAEERAEAGCLVGVPEACGTFLIGVTAIDEPSGLAESRRLDLSIFCDAIRLTTRTLPAATRGDAYPEFQLLTNAEGQVFFELAGGELPLGLALSSDGKIFGDVAVDAPVGSHAAVVRFHDEAGGSGVGVVAIDVLPDPVRTVTQTDTTKSGCSTSGEGPAGLLPFAALFALLGLRRRARGAAALAGVAAALLLPAAAAAQTTPGYAVYHHPKPWEPLTGASQLNPSGSNTAFIINLNGWTVPFFGEPYPKFLVHENGLILFGANNAATTPYRIPYASSSSARNFIAGWWDDHNMYQRPGKWLWKSRGTSPNREIVVEWNWETNITTDSTSGGQHQISVFQDGTIKIRWGEIIDTGESTSSHQAVIGLMDAHASPASVPFLDCSVYTTSSTAGCKSPEWNTYLRNTEAVFTRLPNLQIRATSTHFEGLAGLEQTYSATVYNYGPFPAAAPVRFFASRDTTFSPDDVAIGTTATVTVGAFAEAQVELTAPLPRGLDVERYFLLAVADPDDTLVEYLDDDNAGGSASFRVVEARPDLTVVRLGAPAAGAPGATLTLDLEVKNAGNLDVAGVPYLVVLSDNEVISGSDLPLYQGTLDAGWLQTVETSFVATLPASIPPGLYHLGVVLDPEGTVDELNKLNNVGAAARPFVVSSEGLLVLNGSTWTVQIGSEFCVPLQAAGGDGVYTWSLLDGTLPPGIALVPGGATGGALCGRPTGVGIFDFTVGVTSGNLAAESEMSIEVIPDHLGLSISLRELPLARFQIAYEAGLVAFGGDGPYRWELISGILPAGLTFEDDGLIFGTPLEAGSYTFVVRVTDGANRTASETISLLVAPPARITCSSRTLGTLPVDVPVSGKLLAGGAQGSYEWSTVSTRRYGDTGGRTIPENEPPPGIVLSVTGVLSGTPLEVGQYLWTVEVKAGADADTCVLTVDVVADGSLSVTTRALPNAAPGKEYGVRLQAIGGTGTLTWALADDYDLPAGLTLAPDGTLSGVPAAEALEGEESRTFGFLVEVRDERNLRGVAALSLTVAPEATGRITIVEREETTGCQAGGGGFSLAALGLALLALRRRR